MNQPSNKESPENLIFSEAEARAVGVNLQDKTAHYLYRAIQERSTPGQAKGGELYTVGMMIPELTSRSDEEIIDTLKKLTELRMILPIILIDRDPITKTISFTPSFVARKDDNLDAWLDLYGKILERTISLLESQVNGMDPVGREQLVSDLEFDYNALQRPEPDRLNYTTFNINGIFNPSLFPFHMDSDLLANFRKDVIKELQSRNRIIPVRGFEYIPFREEDFGLRFKTAVDFMKSRIFPRYDKSEEMRTEWNRIGMQEAAYRLEEFQAPSAEFDLQRADLLDRTIRKTKGDDSTWYAGRLTIEIIRASREKIKSILQKQHDSDLQAENSGFRNSLIDSSDLISCIRFIPRIDFEKIHPTIRDSILKDRRILNIVWETRKQQFYIFVTTDKKVLRDLIIKVATTRLLDQWKVTAFRLLLEQSADRLPPMIADHELQKYYGMLELQGLKPGFSSFFQVLFSMGINLFRNYACDRARRTILRQQDEYRRANEGRWNRFMDDKKIEKEKHRENLENRMRFEQVREALARLYYAEETIPTVRELQQSMSGFSLPVLRELLMEGGFQLLRQDNQDADNSIVIFPLDYEWRSHSVRIFKVLENLFMKEVLQDPGRAQNIARARILQKHLEKTRTLQTSAEPPSSRSSDPYQKLQRAIDKNK